MTTRKFRVTVDGETFEVEVEELAGPELGGAALTRTAPAIPTAPPSGPAPRVIPAAPQSTAAPPAGGGRDPSPAGADPAREVKPARTAQDRPEPDGVERVEAPLPGTVVDIKARPGQSVAAGEVLLILEAMKMQNEIVSPRDGVVREILVAKGDTVSLGDVLVYVG